MTKIRARCPACGDVEFGIDRIVVLGESAHACAYRFVCPSCDEAVSRTAVPDVIELLLSAGVRRESLEHPSFGNRFAAPTSFEAAETGIGAQAPLTEHDVDSFRRLLDSEDWFEALRASNERD